jgi:hypothetical protein
VAEATAAREVADGAAVMLAAKQNSDIWIRNVNIFNCAVKCLNLKIILKSGRTDPSLLF